MSVPAAVWMLVGLMTGLAHAGALWSHAHRARRVSAGTLWRVPLVVIVLIAAAVAGHVFAAGAGWVVGFAATSLALVVRSRL